ncbi:MAG: bifunctional pyr operon transcriptional regulator/uracil phosphoribosyltransferase PyrR [Gammaproteobacteria bacterium]|nr:MAG: bifunctional pyr operon transcriptional regulator/uracil phosphoribosyltransferase PyrR [Gammaproteobacteria bacterium]
MPEVEPLLGELAEGLRRLLAERGVARPCLVGIHTGGVWVAQRLHAALGVAEPLGILDISFYRDDFTRVGMNPAVRPSQIPFEVDERDIVLVDDVLYTGRTIRAALNEIFDYGRPRRVLLAVLVDRGGRELPIQPDVAALRLALGPKEHVKLAGPEPLRLVRVRRDEG